MKKLIYIFLLFVTTAVFSQNNGITYQAVIYMPGGQNAPGVNVSNVPMTNKNICLQFSLLDANNRLEYQEEIKVKTDEFGMVNITIGNGVQSGGYASSYAAIVWNALSQKNLQVAFDSTGLCNQFDPLSNEPINSIPFANAAITAGNVTGVVALVNGGTGATTAAGARANLGIGNIDNTSDLDKPISTATKNYVDNQLASGTIVDADATTKGKIQLAGDLAGTAGAPTVPGLALKENAANKSTTTTLGTSNVLFPTQNAVKTYVDTAIAGATIVDADAATKGKIQLAGDLAGTAGAPTVPGLALKENAANKSTTTTLGTSNVLFPTQNAVKTYVDNAVSGATIVDADAATKGKIKLAGDLTGTADAPTIASNAITDIKIATVSGSKITGNIPGNATNVTGVVGITNGGTGATSVSAARTNLGLGSAALNNSGDFEVPLSFASPLVRTVNSIAVPPADATVNGYLKATDFYTFSNKISSTEKAANNGVATLGNDGKIPSSQIPSISFQSVNVVNSQAAMIANSAAQVGSITIRTDINRNFVLSSLPASTLSNWIELSTPNSVTSVNGYAGPNVSLTKADIVLGNVDNTSDNNKPISIDTRAALDLKANLASPTFTGTVSGITKTMVGLGNVDNTTDAGKPVSTATQTALDLKANVADVTTSLALKANVTDVTTSLALKANVTDVTTSIALKEDTANKTINVTTDGASDVKFPSAKAVKTYADSKVVDGITDAVTTTSPSQNAVYDALQLKENTANKSTAIDLGSTNPSDVLFPSQKAVKTYVDLQSANAGVADASLTSAKILDGTLVAADFADGSVTTPKLASNAVTTAKITDANVTDAKLDKANIPLSGFGAATANVALGANKLTGVADPSAAQDAAT
ncbi:MAG: hypothetical protein KA509_03735, partial [Flavobacterium sp.]|nr:hypothetical protein [Flavobacterium sp.]